MIPRTVTAPSEAATKHWPIWARQSHAGESTGCSTRTLKGSLTTLILGSSKSFSGDVLKTLACCG
ncbi:hypothetical protein Rcae01_06812 [Novipirellula caenicola]|uniref:Uncharacterized protein n=1 Tax=Novipirellula caenicola TaxID=1536901 RepID=A0ABP9W1N1_9BACT